MNAKSELIEHVADRVVLCAKIIHGSDYDENRTNFVLRVGHTRPDRDAFLQSLDFEYDSGFGGQELYGNVWYQDGTWSDRGEYDGSEWWQYQSAPKIPEECTAGHCGSFAQRAYNKRSPKWARKLRWWKLLMCPLRAGA